MSLNGSGLAYGACYHSDYTLRSLVDKEYVDSIGTSITVSNGLTRLGNDIKLGGVLTGNTLISGTGNTISFGVINDSVGSFNVSALESLKLTVGDTMCGGQISMTDNAGMTIQSKGLQYTDTTTALQGIRYHACYHDTYDDRSLVDKEYVVDTVNSFTGGSVFDHDITVSISQDKSFGRYLNNDVIPSSGKTPAEVIIMALAEPLNPVLTLSSNYITSDELEFGEPNKKVYLRFTHIIMTVGAVVDSAILEANRDGNWVTISANPAESSLQHDLVNAVDRFDKTSVMYKYTVIDDKGASQTINLTVTPDSYANPTYHTTYVGSVDGVFEGQTYREFGNVNTTIEGILPTRGIFSNNNQVKLTGYDIMRSLDGGSTYQSINAETGYSLDVKTITTFVDTTTPIETSQVRYKIVGVDEFKTTEGSPWTINFEDVSYYGFSTAETITTPATLIALGNEGLYDSRERTTGLLDPSEFEYSYFVYPAAYGDWTSAMFDGVSPMISANDSAFQKQAPDTFITNSHGVGRSYIVMRTNAPDAFDNNFVEFS
jgi:hypothetical protein